MNQHSKIGPSALHRLLACPGSHKLAQTKPHGGSSSYAAQGTVAHTIIEAQLSDDVIQSPAFDVGDVIVEEGHQIVVDEEMLEGVREMVAFCEPLKTNATQHWIEARVDLAPLWDGDPPEPIFGTTDFGAFHAETDTLYVVDFKYGRLSVSPHDNPQAFAYTLGLVFELGHVPANVVVVIIQPRGQDGQTVKMVALSGLDLMIWADTVLKPGVNALFDPNPGLRPGDHCRFCPAKIDCPALYELAQKAARTDFSTLPADPMTFTNDELAHVLNNAEAISLWIDAVRAEASGRIEKGQKLPNWKLVPKRAVRRWADEVFVAEVLEDTPDAWAAPKLKSPTQVEKVDPDAYRRLESVGMVDKSSSGTTLVPDLDPRIAVTNKSAKEEFSAIEG